MRSDQPEEQKEDSRMKKTISSRWKSWKRRRNPFVAISALDTDTHDCDDVHANFGAPHPHETYKERQPNPGASDS